MVGLSIVQKLPMDFMVGLAAAGNSSVLESWIEWPFEKGLLEKGGAVPIGGIIWFVTRRSPPKSLRGAKARSTDLADCVE